MKKALKTTLSQPSLRRLGGVLTALAASALLTACSIGQITAPSNNISLIVSPTTNQLLVFDLLTHRVVTELETGNRPDDLAVSSDSRRILVTNINDGSVSIFERLTGTEFISRGKVTVQGTLPQGVVFNSTGTRAYVAVGDTATIATLDTSVPSRLPNIIAQGVVRLNTGTNQTKRPSPSQMAVSPDNTRLFVVDRANGRLLAFNINPGQDTITPAEFFQIPVTVTSDLRDLAVDRAGRVYVLNTASDELLVFNAANIQQPVAQVSLRDSQIPANVPVSPENIAINNAGSKMYITGSSANVLTVIPNPRALAGNINLQSVGRNIPLNTDPRRPTTSPNGVDVTSNDKLIYVANGGGGYNISLINGETDLPTRSFGTSANAATSSPLGRLKVVFYGTPGVLGQAIQSERVATPDQPASSFRFFFDNP
ncbi:MAG: YncE family protein [Candidatus Sericytochromatia bacterium]|nr:YncE family protein [Candidatus Sericytochromatia bacterium]